MKKIILITSLLCSLLLGGCNKTNNQQSSNDDASPVEPNNPLDPSEPVEPGEEDDSKIDHITLNKSELVLIKGKYEYLSVNFFPDDETTEDLHDGTWSVSDSSVATISEHGKVTGISKGKTTVTFTTKEGKRTANCTVYVFNSEEEIVKRYMLVTDADSIKEGDQIIFACPQKGVVASTDYVSGYLKPTSCYISSGMDILLSYGDDTAIFYVSEGENGGLILENQNNEYLAGKSTSVQNSVYFSNDKGAINWIFETPEGYENIFCVNNDIEEDLWLMFNCVDNSTGDIRFSLYDSTPHGNMYMPEIYRLTTILEDDI
ncbi:MAG: Ig-like domain-containing protein [Bacilli bacterium]|nr:Ig-like domain-containing protein [Bacilli bacterium]